MDLSKKHRQPKRWTEEEDGILYEEATKQSTSGSVRDWHRIATRLPGRTNKDCRKRWVNKVRGGLKKGFWDAEEDARLRAAVNKHGQRWALIANEVGFRSPDQCAKRWQYCLDPKLKLGEWTTDEGELLLSLVKKHGRKWKFIHHQHFPSRSRIDLKNRFVQAVIVPGLLNSSGHARITSTNPKPWSRYTILTRKLSSGGTAAGDRDMCISPSASYSDDDDDDDDEDEYDEDDIDDFDAGDNDDATMKQHERHAPTSSVDSEPAALSAALMEYDSNLLSDACDYMAIDCMDTNIPYDLLGPGSSASGAGSSFAALGSPGSGLLTENPHAGGGGPAKAQFLPDMTFHSVPGMDDAPTLDGHQAWGQPGSTVAGIPAEVYEMVMVVKDCDRTTLHYLLNVSRSISGNVEIKISPR